MAYNPFRKLGLKFLSVVIAVMFWLAVGGEQIVERTLRSPLELQNIPENLEVVGEAPSTVDVRVRGASTALGQLSAGDVVTVVDTGTAKPGRRLIHVTPDNVRVPFGIEVTFVGPATIPLQFERQAIKTIPVAPAIEGQPAAGYFIEDLQIDPAEVEVIGPESALRILQQAATEPVEIGGATTSVREVVNIGLPDSSARLRSPRTARVTVSIAPVRSERTLTNVPVRMKNLRSSLSARAAPSNVTVTVRGPDDVLRELSTDDVVAEVDLSGLGPGGYTLDVSVTSRLTLGIVRIGPQQVQILIR
ncbi:MAG: CdaR family protein [Vicinamibacterales bacterium]|nr:CdaR family protein [Vicinamibacterales bacterium]